jgi:hypothetical protein
MSAHHRSHPRCLYGTDRPRLDQLALISGTPSTGHFPRLINIQTSALFALCILLRPSGAREL